MYNVEDQQFYYNVQHIICNFVTSQIEIFFIK